MGRSDSPSQHREGLQRIASETFALSGDVARLVTFLNQSLKEKGFIFGLTKAGSDYGLAIYTTDEHQPTNGD